MADGKQLFLTEASKLPAYEGWKPEEIEANVREVLAGAPERRQALIGSLRGNLYDNNWQDDEIAADLGNLFPKQLQPDPNSVEMPGPQVLPAPLVKPSGPADEYDRAGSQALRFQASGHQAFEAAAKPMIDTMRQQPISIADVVAGKIYKAEQDYDRIMQSLDVVRTHPTFTRGMDLIQRYNEAATQFPDFKAYRDRGAELAKQSKDLEAKKKALDEHMKQPLGEVKDTASFKAAESRQAEIDAYNADVQAFQSQAKAWEEEGKKYADLNKLAEQTYQATSNPEFLSLVEAEQGVVDSMKNVDPVILESKQNEQRLGALRAFAKDVLARIPADETQTDRIMTMIRQHPGLPISAPIAGDYVLSTANQAREIAERILQTTGEGGLGAGVAENVQAVLPYVQSLAGALESDAVKSLEAKPNKTDAEQALVDISSAWKEYERIMPTSVGYDIGSGLAAMAGYAGEIAATGGIYNAVKSGILKAVPLGVVRAGVKTGSAAVEAGTKLLTRALPSIGGAAVQSLTNLPGIWKGINDRITQQYHLTFTPAGQVVKREALQEVESLLPSVLKSLGVNGAEYITERWGVIFDKAPQAAKKFLATTILGRWMQKAGVSSVDKALDALKKSTAWSSVVGEFMEEFWNKPLQSLVEKGELEWMTDPREIITTLGTVGLPGAVGGAARMGARGLGVAQEKRAISKEELADHKKYMELSDKAHELSNKHSELFEKLTTDTPEEERKAILAEMDKLQAPLDELYGQMDELEAKSEARKAARTLSAARWKQEKGEDYVPPSAEPVQEGKIIGAEDLTPAQPSTQEQPGERGTATEAGPSAVPPSQTADLAPGSSVMLDGEEAKIVEMRGGSVSVEYADGSNEILSQEEFDAKRGGPENADGIREDQSVPAGQGVQPERREEARSDDLEQQAQGRPGGAAPQARQEEKSPAGLPQVAPATSETETEADHETAAHQFVTRFAALTNRKIREMSGLEEHRMEREAYKEAVDGWRNLDEAEEDVKGWRDDQVIYTKRGLAVSKPQMLDLIDKARKIGNMAEREMEVTLSDGSKAIAFVQKGYRGFGKGKHYDKDAKLDNIEWYTDNEDFSITGYYVEHIHEDLHSLPEEKLRKVLERHGNARLAENMAYHKNRDKGKPVTMVSVPAGGNVKRPAKKPKAADIVKGEEEAPKAPTPAAEWQYVLNDKGKPKVYMSAAQALIAAKKLESADSDIQAQPKGYIERQHGGSYMVQYRKRQVEKPKIEALPEVKKVRAADVVKEEPKKPAPKPVEADPLVEKGRKDADAAIERFVELSESPSAVRARASLLIDSTKNLIESSRKAIKTKKDQREHDAYEKQNKAFIARLEERLKEIPDETTSERTDALLEQSRKMKVVDVPLDELSTDVKTFQNREDEYSEESVKKITDAIDQGKFSWAEFDPILAWRSPEGKLFILSGHSRTEAFRRAVKAGKADFKVIPTKILEGATKAEAKAIAKKSNTLSTKESPIERAKYYRDMREEGKTKKEIVEEAEQLEGRNATAIINLSYLNPKGLALDAIRALGVDRTDDSRTAMTLAELVGEIRQGYKGLTNAHEEEIYSFLRENWKTVGRKFETKSKFREFIDNVIDKRTTFGEVDYSKPLNLKSLESKSATEIEYDQRIEDAKEEFARAKVAYDKKAKELQDRLHMTKELLARDPQEYERKRTERDKALVKEKEEMIVAEREYVRLQQGRDAAMAEIRGSEMSLFGEIEKEADDARAKGATAEELRAARERDSDAGESGTREVAAKPQEPEQKAGQEEGEIDFMRAPVEPRMVAMHNLGAAEILSAAKLGGMPMPSLAVVTPATMLEDYGDVSLIGTRELADPKTTPVFGGDVWSPTKPEIFYSTKPKERKKLMAEIHGVRGEAKYYHYMRWADDYLEKDRLAPEGGVEYGKTDTSLQLLFLKRQGEKLPNIPKTRKTLRFAHGMTARAPKAVAAFLEKHPSVDRNSDWATPEMLDDLAELAKAIHREYLEKRYKKLDPVDRAFLTEQFSIASWLFKPDGTLTLHANMTLLDDLEILRDKLTEPDYGKFEKIVAKRIDEIGRDKYEAWLKETFDALADGTYIKDGRKKLPVTAENILRAMRQTIRNAEEGFMTTPARLAAAVSPRFYSVEGMREEAGRITPTEEFKKAKDASYSEWSELAGRIADTAKYREENPFIAHGRAMDALLEGVKGQFSRYKIAKSLREWQFQPSEALMDDIMEAFERLSKAPTEYFEAKPQRIVSFNEFKAAVVPNDLAPEAKAVLDQNGIQQFVYQKDDEVDRRRAFAEAINSNDDLQFQRAGKTHEQRANEEIDALRKFIVDVEARLQVKMFDGEPLSATDQAELVAKRKELVDRLQYMNKYGLAEARAKDDANKPGIQTQMWSDAELVGQGEIAFQAAPQTQAALARNGDQWYYSQMRKVFEAQMPGKIKAGELKKLVASWLKAGKFKAEDWEWNTASEELAALEDDTPVTKQEMLIALSRGQLTVKDLVLGHLPGAIANQKYEQYTLRGEHKNYAELLLTLPYMANYAPNADALKKELDNIRAKIAAEAEADEKRRALVDAVKKAQEATRQFVTGDADIDQRLAAREKAEEALLQYDSVKWRREYGRIQEINERLEEIGGGEGDYKSPHFSNIMGATNPVVHVRFDERREIEEDGITHEDGTITPTKVQGDPILFIEEIQSDWHQAGRKSGYNTQPIAKAEEVMSWDEEHKTATVQYPEGEWRFSTNEYKPNGKWNIVAYSDDDPMGVDLEGVQLFDTEAEAIAWLRDGGLRRRVADELVQYGKIGVPNAPFKTTWHELALKRMIRWAADNGYNTIAWTTGTQQNERYKLSAYVSEIRYQKNDEGKYNLSVYSSTTGDLVSRPELTKAFTPEELEEVVGKEIARKIVAGEGEVVRRKIPPATFHRGRAIEVFDASTREKFLEPGRNWAIRYEHGEEHGFYRTKEEAEKAAEETNRLFDAAPKSLSGVALEIGGAGMKGFYDKILVDAANKIGKKYGAKVGTAEIAIGFPASGPYQTVAIDSDKGKIETVHALPITSALREAAWTEGLPLFQQKGTTNEAAGREGRLASTPAAGEVVPPEGSLPEAGQSETLVRLNQILTSRGYGPATAVTSHEILNTRAFKVSNEVAKALTGHPVTVVTQRNPYFYGAHLRHPRTGESHVFIDVSSPDPILSTVMHEVMHSIQKQHHDLYGKLMDLYVEELGSIEKLERNYANLGIPPYDDQYDLVAEGLNDFVAENALDRGFWQRLANRSYGLARELFETIKRYVNEVLGRTYSRPTSQLLRNKFRVLTEAESVIAEVMRRRRAASMTDTTPLFQRMPSTPELMARGLFRAVAIKVNGKVYEGKPGDMHFSVQERLPEEVFFTYASNDNARLEYDGFLTLDGRFVNRVDAAKLVSSDATLPFHGTIIAESQSARDTGELVERQQPDFMATGLFRAVAVKINGKVYEGKPGQIHADVWGDVRDGKFGREATPEELEAFDDRLGMKRFTSAGSDKMSLAFNNMDGFVTRDGNFLSRTQAGEYLDHPAFAESSILRESGTLDFQLVPTNAPAPAVNTEFYGDLKTETIFNSPEKRRELMTSIQRKYQDALVDLKRVIENVRKEGRIVYDTENPYLQEELSYGKIERDLAAFDTNLFKPFIEALADAERQGVTMGDVRAYLYAKHAPERNEFIREKYADVITAYQDLIVNTTNPAQRQKYQDRLDEMNRGSGLSDSDAQAMLAGFNARGVTPTLEAVAEKMYAINRFDLDNRLKYGLITQEYYDTLNEQYDYYMPLKGWEESAAEDETRARTGRGLDIRGSEYIGPRGRASIAGDILSYASAQAMEGIIRGHKNLVQQSFLKFVVGHPNKDAYRIMSVVFVPERDRETGKPIVDEEDGKAVYKVMYRRPRMDELRTGGVKWALDEDTEKVIGFDMSNIYRDPNIVALKVLGKPVFIKVMDPNLAAGMKRLNVQQMEGILVFINRQMAWLRKFITQYSPEFAATNFVRDLWTASFHASANLGPGAIPAVWSGIPGALRGLHAAFRGNLTSEWAQIAEEYRNEGAMTGYWSMEPIEERTRKLVKQVEHAQTNPGWKAFKESVTFLPEFIDDANRVVENGVRLSTYKYLTREKHWTKARAASYAKNLTVNFNRKGEKSSVLGTLYLFANANIQGVARMIQGFNHADPGVRARSYAQAALMIFSGYAFQAVMRELMGKGDDDEYWYDKINPYTRKHSIIIPKFFTDDPKDYVRIPLPYGYNLFWSIGDEILRAANGQEIDATLVSTMAAMVDAFSPMGTAQGKGPIGTLGKTIAPTVVDPIAELMDNTDFSGRTIYPDNPFDNKPESEKYFPSVSPVIRATTDYLNEITGGDQRTPGAVSISPEVVEYLLGFYTGGVGKFGMSIVNAAASIADETARFEPTRLPFARTFMGQISPVVDQQKFRENSIDVNAVAENYTDAIKQMKFAEAQKVAAKHPWVYLQDDKGVPLLEIDRKKAQKDIKDLRDQYKASRNPDEKERLLEESARVAREFNKKYRRASEMIR